MQIKSGCRSGCRSSSEVRGLVNEIPAPDRRRSRRPAWPPPDEPLPAQCAAPHTPSGMGGRERVGQQVVVRTGLGGGANPDGGLGRKVRV